VILGVSGTRHDPPPPQAGILGVELALAYKPDAALALGDATGVDSLAHAIGRRLGYTLHGHPPLKAEFRAFLEYDTCAQPQSYAVRDAAIVASADRLIAAPAAREADSPRSGTWLTVRYARTKGIPIRIVWPDGTLTHERRR
jgi:hypothetical protein